MPLISEGYRKQNIELHLTNDNYGTSGQKYLSEVEFLIACDNHADVLDYGCGKGTLADGLRPLGRIVHEYDPAIAGKDSQPQPADLVVCTDVLEHIEPPHLNSVIRHLKSLTKSKLFFSIATVPAGKFLPDGRNAHISLHTPDWWRKKLSQSFLILSWNILPNGRVYGQAAAHVARKPGDRARTRRAMTREWQQKFDEIRETSAKYNDEFSRINTIRMWEGKGDEPADMQVCCQILEHLPDLDAAFTEVVKLSRKAVMVTLIRQPGRDEKFWRAFFEQRLRISDWHVDEASRGLVMIGSPMVGVKGITGVGAVDVDKRWDQVVASCARFPGRIEPSGAHSRRAIVVCYGPSLAATVDILKREAALEGVDVFSVSGSHDFLLQNGIVPKYHIECDPRPHKADNIAKAHPDTTYLIASCCAGPLFDKLEGADVKLWHIGCGEHSIRLVDELGADSATMISGGGSVGLRSIPLLYGLGYREMYFFAMDCSFADNGEKQWAGKHAGKRQDLCQVQCGEQTFFSSPQLLTYATNFFETIQKTQDITYRLYGEGLLQSMAQYYANQIDNVQTEEAA